MEKEGKKKKIENFEYHLDETLTEYFVEEGIEEIGDKAFSVYPSQNDDLPYALAKRVVHDKKSEKRFWGCVNTMTDPTVSTQVIRRDGPPDSIDAIDLIRRYRDVDERNRSSKNSSSSHQHTKAALRMLILDRATVPFVARYRREETGGADAKRLESLIESFRAFEAVETRKAKMVAELSTRKSKEGRHVLTAKLRNQIANATRLSELDDLWLPFRKARCTRADIARAKGLEPIASKLFERPETIDEDYLRKVGLYHKKDTKQGVTDLLAQRFAECKRVREALRDLVTRYGTIRVTEKKQSKTAKQGRPTGKKKTSGGGRKERVGRFEMYYDWSGSLSRIKSHHVLAIERGAREKELNVVVKIEHPCCFTTNGNNNNNNKNGSATAEAKKRKKKMTDSTRKTTKEGLAILTKRIVRIVRHSAWEACLEDRKKTSDSERRVHPEQEAQGRRRRRQQRQDHPSSLPSLPRIAKEIVQCAAEDAWKRLIRPSLVRGARKKLRDQAHASAIECFAKNLQGLLLQRPYRAKRVLGIDPGFRMGCKLAAVDEQGKVLALDVVYLHDRRSAFDRLSKMIRTHRVELVALGNGKASRETETLVGEIIAATSSTSSLSSKTPGLRYVVVDEAGVSVYSTSEKAREEFGQCDDAGDESKKKKRKSKTPRAFSGTTTRTSSSTVRIDDPLAIGAVSIARRLQDPMSELVKVPPVALGVGMYQHDVPEKKLTSRLDAVVTSVVSDVGVEVNTASVELLRRVAGLNLRTASALHAAARSVDGGASCSRRFRTREDLRRVLKPRVFEQAAGFLRISDGTCSLDNTNVHPESYATARAILAVAKVPENLSHDEDDGDTSRAGKLASLTTDDLERVARTHKVSVESVKRLRDFLKAPGRLSDPRLRQPHLPPRTGPLRLDDLRVGDVVLGRVKNRVPYGLFVDIGVDTDALLHFSRCRGNNDTMAADLDVASQVHVVVLDVDTRRRRIAIGPHSVDAASNTIPKRVGETRQRGRETCKSNSNDKDRRRHSGFVRTQQRRAPSSVSSGERHCRVGAGNSIGKRKRPRHESDYSSSHRGQRIRDNCGSKRRRGDSARRPPQHRARAGKTGASMLRHGASRKVE
eukprot:g3654.t1